MGRPSKYDYWASENGLILIMTWARAGYTDSEIAKKMGIATSTLYDWQLKHPIFSEAFKKNKEIADMLVVNALYQRCIGSSYKEVTKERILNTHTRKYEMVVTKEVERYLYPDVNAIKIWLYNRQREQWGENVNDYAEVQSEQDNKPLIDALENNRKSIQVNSNQSITYADDKNE